MPEIPKVDGQGKTILNFHSSIIALMNKLAKKMLVNITWPKIRVHNGVYYCDFIAAMIDYNYNEVPGTRGKMTFRLRGHSIVADNSKPVPMTEKEAAELSA